MESLNEIYEAYKALGLGGKNGISDNFVPGDGPVPANLMIIGEAPGAEEDKIGKPFQGSAGRVLDRLLGFSHVQRQDIFITNVFKYRPPENREPYPDEIRKSLPFLSAEIKVIDPLLIILAGKTAINTVFPGVTVKSVRGRITKKGSRYIMPTYHPAVNLYSPNSSSDNAMKRDFRRALEFVLSEGSDGNMSRLE